MNERMCRDGLISSHRTLRHCGYALGSNGREEDENRESSELWKEAVWSLTDRARTWVSKGSSGPMTPRDWYHADQSGPTLFRDILGLLRRKKRKILDFLLIRHLVLKQLIENDINVIIKMDVFLYSCRSHLLKKTMGFWILSQDLLTTYLLSLVSPLHHCLNRQILIKKVSQKCYLKRETLLGHFS